MTVKGLFRRKWASLGFLVLFILLFSFTPALAQKPLVAVLPVQEGDLAWRGFRSRDILNGMTQLLTDRLAQADNIRVVERTRVYDILDEQDFGQSHRVDAETAAAIGRILGVDFLVLSTLTQLDVGEKGEISFGPLSVSGVTAEVVLSGRVVDATTAEVMGSYRGEGRNTQAALSVSDLKGLSFGSNAFSSSALGKSIQAAVDDFSAHVMADIDSFRTVSREMEGSIVAILGSKLIIDIGRNHRVANKQTGI